MEIGWLGLVMKFWMSSVAAAAADGDKLNELEFGSRLLPWSEALCCVDLSRIGERICSSRYSAVLPAAPRKPNGSELSTSFLALEL